MQVQFDASCGCQGDEEPRVRQRKRGKPGTKTVAEMESGDKCHQCRNEFTADERFCPQCGAERAVGAVVPPSHQHEEHEEHEEDVDDLKFRRRTARGSSDFSAVSEKERVVAENLDLMERMRELERINEELRRHSATVEEDLLQAQAQAKARREPRSRPRTQDFTGPVEEQTPLQKARGHFMDALVLHKQEQQDEAMLSLQAEKDQAVDRYEKAREEMVRLRAREQEHTRCLRQKEQELDVVKGALEQARETIHHERGTNKQKSLEVEKLREEIETLIATSDHTRPVGVSNAFANKDSRCKSLADELGDLRHIGQDDPAEDAAEEELEDLRLELSSAKAEAKRLEAELASAKAAAVSAKPLSVANVELQAEAKRLQAALVSAEEECRAAVASGEQQQSALEEAKAADSGLKAELERLQTALSASEGKRVAVVAARDQQEFALQEARATNVGLKAETEQLQAALASAQEQQQAAVLVGEQREEQLQTALASAQAVEAANAMLRSEVERLLAEPDERQLESGKGGQPGRRGSLEEARAASDRLRAEVAQLQAALAAAEEAKKELEPLRAKLAEADAAGKSMDVGKLRKSCSDEEPEISGARKQEVQELRREVEMLKKEVSLSQAREREALTSVERLKKDIAAPKAASSGDSRGRQREQQELLHRVVDLQRELALARKQAHEWKLQANQPWYERIISCNSCVTKRPGPDDILTAPSTLPTAVALAGAESGPER